MARFKVFVPLVLALLLAVPATASAATLARGSGEGWSTWIRSIWAAIGCTINPNGFCAQEPKSTIACGNDPNGLCGSAPAPAEIGCGIDPNGHCHD